MPFWNRKKRWNSAATEALSKVRGIARSGSAPLLRELDGRRRLRSIFERDIIIPAAAVGGFRDPIGGGFTYTGANRGEFYRWMRDSIPVISAGVWTWVRLCTTRITREIEGSDSARRRALELIADLDARILEMPYGRGSGLTRLAEAFFLELFTTGRFAGEAVIPSDESRVDHFRFIEPSRVSWEHSERGWEPVVEDDVSDGSSRQPVRLRSDRFFYGTLGSDLSNPAGMEPLATIPFVAEIEQLMLEDMARSSHNAGTPRLQVKISRPDRFSWEGDKEYHDRINRYFDDLVKAFQTLDADDNIFTWGDVEVTVIGGGKMWDWRLNREQVIEDVITGLKLFPWVLGRSQKATHQWVQSQYDLLMQMVETQRRIGADLIDWLCNLELALHGVDARVRHRFNAVPDPFRLNRARAAEVELHNIDFKVQRGYISKDDGARELGYESAYKRE